MSYSSDDERGNVSSEEAGEGENKSEYSSDGSITIETNDDFIPLKTCISIGNQLTVRDVKLTKPEVFNDISKYTNYSAVLQKNIKHAVIVERVKDGKAPKRTRSSQYVKLTKKTIQTFEDNQNYRNEFWQGFLQGFTEKKDYQSKLGFNPQELAKELKIDLDDQDQLDKIQISSQNKPIIINDINKQNVGPQHLGEVVGGISGYQLWVENDAQLKRNLDSLGSRTHTKKNKTIVDCCTSLKLILSFLPNGSDVTRLSIASWFTWEGIEQFTSLTKNPYKSLPVAGVSAINCGVSLFQNVESCVNIKKHKNNSKVVCREVFKLFFYAAKFGANGIILAGSLVPCFSKEPLYDFISKEACIGINAGFDLLQTFYNLCNIWTAKSCDCMSKIRATFKAISSLIADGGSMLVLPICQYLLQDVIPEEYQPVVLFGISAMMILKTAFDYSSNVHDNIKSVKADQQVKFEDVTDGIQGKSEKELKTVLEKKPLLPEDHSNSSINYKSTV